MMQVCTTKVTSFATLIELENYFKYFASRTHGVSTAINNLFEQIFADPSYEPMLATSTCFVQLLNEIKPMMPNAIEYGTIEHVALKHYQRLWKHSLNNGELWNAYIFRIQIQRNKGIPGALEIAFDPTPVARFSRNICIYRSKADLANLGNYIEIGEPDNIVNPALNFQQYMECACFQNSDRPWFLFVNEANITAYEEVLQYILSKANLGTKKWGTTDLVLPDSIIAIQLHDTFNFFIDFMMLIGLLRQEIFCFE